MILLILLILLLIVLSIIFSPFLLLTGNFISMILCPIIAHNKFKSEIGWFFIGLFFGPIGLLILCCLD